MSSFLSKMGFVPLKRVNGLFSAAVGVGQLVWISIHRILNLAIIKSINLKCVVALQPHS